jgi:hypothetical protein
MNPAVARKAAIQAVFHEILQGFWKFLIIIYAEYPMQRANKYNSQNASVFIFVKALKIIYAKGSVNGQRERASLVRVNSSRKTAQSHKHI